MILYRSSVLRTAESSHIGSFDSVKTVVCNWNWWFLGEPITVPRVPISCGVIHCFGKVADQLLKTTLVLQLLDHLHMLCKGALQVLK